MILWHGFSKFAIEVLQLKSSLRWQRLSGGLVKSLPRERL